ncbi:MAG: serine/threonine-protein kinase PknK [Bradymonadales bacterium]|nr:serine/threonine-protein kinase PknK [Bradymonadales bacterium]
MLVPDQFGHPSQFGRYELSERLAQGRTCDVFLATSHGVEGFRRTVVIKRLHPELASDEEFVDRYLFQVKRLFALSHANIVQVLDLDEFDGHYFLTEEYVEGYDLATLRDMAAAGTLLFEAPLGLYIVAEVVKGVEYGHRRLDPTSLEPLKLCHGDLHPRNILVGFQGEVKVADFGIHRPIPEHDLSSDPGILRAYAYASPEVANGEAPTQQSDAFALGLLTVEVCAGRHPYAARSAERVKEKALRGVIAPHYLNQIPASFRELITAALQMDPAERLVDLGILYDRIISYLHEEHDYAGARPLAAFVEDVADIDLRTAVVYSGMIASEHFSTFPSDPGLSPAEGLSSADSLATQARPRQLVVEPPQITLPGADKEPLGANGREREIEWIQEEVTRLEGNQCRCVLVSGPRGVGKSHLLKVAWSTLVQQEIPAVLVAPTVDAAARPYGVILDCLSHILLDRPLLWTSQPGDRLCQALEEAGLGDPDSRHLVGRVVTLEPTEPPLDLMTTRQAINRVFSDLVASRNGGNCLVLLLDGAERADVLSLELFHTILATESPGPLLLAMSSLNRGLLNEFGRAATQDRRTSIVLSPLQDEETANLITHIAGSAPSSEMIQTSQGIPQWAIELALDWKFGSGEAVKPVPLDLFLRSVPPLQLGLLGMLALSEVPMPTNILARALRVEEEKLASACQGLAALHLIVQRPQEGWSLGLRSLTPSIGKVLQETAQGKARLRVVHLLVCEHQGGDALSRPPQARLLAQARMREEALDIGRDHKSSLVRSGFIDVALNYIDQLVALTDRPILNSPHDSLHLRLEQAQLALSALRLERGLRTLGTLTAQATQLRDEDALLIATAQMARSALRNGDEQRCEELVRSLSNLVDESISSVGQAYATLALAEWNLATGHLERSAELFEKAHVTLASTPQQAGTLPEIRFLLSYLLCRRDEPFRAFDLLDTACPQALADRVSRLRCQGFVALMEGEYPAAVQQLEEAFQCAERVGWSTASLLIAPDLVEALIEARTPDRASKRLTELSRLAGQLNHRPTQTRLGYLESFLAIAGDGKEGTSHLDTLAQAFHQAEEDRRLGEGLEIGWIAWRATGGNDPQWRDRTLALAQQVGDLVRARRLA